MRLTIKHTFSALVLATLMMTSCQQPGGESTGSEYMPDMGHSVAYEANYYNYYYHNTWGSEDEYYKYAQPRLPVPGTIARTKSSSSRGVIIPTQGSTPYYYADTEEDRNRAIAELIDNPYPITETGLGQGKELYNIFCATCHGDKGDGNGYLVRDDGGVYPVQPANFLLDEHINASNGRYYHSIMYGKNLMGAYTDKLSTEERWQVIHYIRSLQAKEKKLVYSQLENTLNSVDRPAGPEAVIAEAIVEKMTDSDHQHGHDHEEGFSHDHEHGHDATSDDDHGHDDHDHSGKEH